MVDLERSTQLTSGPEIRDVAANRSEYEPKAGLHYKATDTAAEFIGDGERWRKIETTGANPSFRSVDAEEATTETLTHDYSDAAPHSPRQPERTAPLNIQPFPGVSNPVIDGSNATDATSPQGVADPFVVFEDGQLHLFAELLANDNHIAHWTSYDGVSWTYDQIVLSPTTSQAFPYTFKYGGTWYMTPSGVSADQLVIYEGDPFPTGWTEVERPITASSGAMRDALLFRWDGRWWTFYSDTNNDLRIYYSDETDGGPTGRSWSEHPSSPDTGGINRPRGRPIVHDHYIDFFGEPNTTLYRITELTTTAFAYQQFRGGRVHRPAASDSTGVHWDNTTTHHVDAMVGSPLGTDLIIADGNDGTDNKSYALGVFTRSDWRREMTRIELSTSQTISSATTTRLTNWSVAYDYGGQWATNEYWAAPVTGQYRITLVVLWDSSTASNFQIRGQIYDRTNATHLTRPSDVHQGGARTTTKAVTTEYLTEGTEIDFRVYQASGAGLDANSFDTFATIERVR